MTERKPTLDWDDEDGMKETATYRDLTLTVEQDLSTGFSPREWDNLTEMVCDHRDYNLGDRRLNAQEEEALNRGGWNLLVRYLRLVRGAVVVLPLWLYDHSGISISTGRVDYWDSGQVGFAMVTKERIEYLGAPPESAERQARAEIKEYDSYLRGDVYGYTVTDADENVIDSCWGFIGYPDGLNEAKLEAEATAFAQFPIPAERESVGI